MKGNKQTKNTPGMVSVGGAAKKKSNQHNIKVSNYMDLQNQDSDWGLYLLIKTNLSIKSYGWICIEKLFGW